MTFLEWFLFLILVGPFLVLAYYMRNESWGTIRSQRDMHRELQRNIKGDYRKPDNSEDL